MKQARRLSSISFDEARKIEAISNFLDPEYFDESSIQKLETINFESLLNDESYFGELYKILNMYQNTDDRYNRILSDAFVFYQEDLYIQTSNAIKKLYSSINRNKNNRDLANEGIIRSKNTILKYISEVKSNMTLNGNYILEIEKEDFFEYKLRDNLDLFHINIGNHKRFYTNKNTLSFDLNLDFDKPTTINTLVVPLCEPFPKYIKSISFTGKIGSDSLVINNLDNYSNGYQLEILFKPITITKIKIEFRNVPTDNISEASYIKEKSIINSITSISNNNQIKHISDGTFNLGREMMLAFIAYPTLRKYKKQSTIRFALNYKGNLKAALGYWKQIDMYSDEDLTLKWTNSNMSLGVRQNTDVKFFELPNQKYFRDQVSESFIFIDKSAKIAYDRGVKVKDYRVFIRGDEEYEIGYLDSEKFITINYKYKEGLALQYNYDTTNNSEDIARVDDFGNIVFRNNQVVDNMFGSLTLSGFHQYYTPMISNITIGLIR